MGAGTAPSRRVASRVYGACSEAGLQARSEYVVVFLSHGPLLTVHLVPPVTPIPTMGVAIARLTKSMSELTTSHAEHSATMSKLREEERILESREKEMREMIAKAEEKRSWFNAFREWVESVATFLDEKVRLLIHVVLISSPHHKFWRHHSSRH